MDRSVSGFGLEGTEEVREYRVHVSSKYLDLTRKKLELTRLPHELESSPDDASENESNWALGAPKGIVEPLVDYWLETYSFRQREDFFNGNYPQFRTSFPVEGQSKELRLHFVHLRSAHAAAVPLLLIPAFPLTNLSLPLPLLKALTAPEAEGEQAFHLVIPSIPGLGFSDAFTSNERVLDKTAGLFDAVMRRLGYEFYLCSGTGSGRSSPGGVDYHLPRLLAEGFAQSCLGVHMLDPLLSAPTGLDGIKFRVAEFWHAGVWGYQPQDFVALKRSSQTRPRRSVAGMLGLREPDTLAYALCDSPVGILSFVASALRRTSPTHGLGKEETVDLASLAWLPGPEAGMRVWCAAAAESECVRTGTAARGKVAVSVFDGGEDGEDYTPPAWASSRFDVVWSRRVEGKSGLVVFEKQDVILNGVRGLATAIGEGDGRLKVQNLREVVVPRGSPVAEDLISLSEVIEEEEDEEESVIQLDAESPDTVIAVPLGSH